MNWRSSVIRKHKIDIERVELNITYDESFIQEMKNCGLKLPDSLQKAPLARKCEFLAGRYCAMRTMQRVGLCDPVQPEIGKHGIPIWPENLLGSISHRRNPKSEKKIKQLEFDLNGTAVAVVAPASSKFKGLGIDQENVFKGEFTHQLARKVLTPDEFEFSKYFSSFDTFITTVFSSKEAIYKAIYLQVNRVLGFYVAEVASVNLAEKYLEFNLIKTLSDNLCEGQKIRVYFTQVDDVIETLCLVE